MAADDLSARAADMPEAAGSVTGPPSGLDQATPDGYKTARTLFISAVVVTYAWVAGAAAPFSTRALISVLIPGALLGAIAYGRPPERIPPPESVDLTGFSYWIVCLALLFEWEASAVRADSPWWHPSLTDLVTPLLGPHEIKSAAFATWLLAGWGLVNR
jgi:hypothetical protein